MKGVLVNLTVTQGSGGNVDPAQVTTNNSGLAQTILTLGAQPDEYNVAASVESLTPVVFTAIAVATLMEPNIAVIPNALNFGNVVVGNFRERIVTVTNQGQVDLEVTDIFCDDNRVTASPNTFTLAMLENREVRVRFTPTDESALTATLTIESNDPDEGTLEIPVTGWGVPYQNRALNLDGSSGYVDLGTPESLSITGPITVEMWVYPKTSGLGFFIRANGQYQFFVQSNNEVAFADTHGNHIHTAANVLTLNTWNHIVGVFSGVSGDAITLDNAKIYINGVSKGNHVGGTWSPSTLTAIDIGRYTGWNSYFNGLIDEVRIWNVARAHEQIQSTMYTSLAGNEPGLAAYWRFDEEPGTPTAHDSSPNGNNGTLIGDADFVEPGAPIALPTVEPNIMVSPTELDFGDVSVGTFKDRTLTVINTGQQDLHVTDISEFIFSGYGTKPASVRQIFSSD